MVLSCFLCGYKRQHGERVHRSLYKFPDDSRTRSAWFNICNLSEETDSVKYIRICSSHFKSDCFVDQEVRTGSGTKYFRLKLGAVPTISVLNPCSSYNQPLAGDVTNVSEPRNVDVLLKEVNIKPCDEYSQTNIPSTLGISVVKPEQLETVTLMVEATQENSPHIVNKYFEMDKRKCWLCSKGNSVVSLHRFPKNTEMCSLWKKVCDLQDYDKVSNLYICSNHFTKEDYINPNVGICGRLSILKPGTVPSVRVPNKILRHAPSDVYNSDTSTSNNSYLLQIKNELCEEIQPSTEDIVYPENKDTSNNSCLLQNEKALPEQSQPSIEVIIYPGKKGEAVDMKIPRDPLSTTSAPVEEIYLQFTNGNPEVNGNVEYQDMELESAQVLSDESTFQEEFDNEEAFNRRLPELSPVKNGTEKTRSQPTRTIGTQTNSNFANTYVHQRELLLSPENVSELCRICLLQPGKFNLYLNQFEGLNYSEILEVIGVKLKNRHPMLICSICEQALIKAYLFKELSKKSESVLDLFLIQVEQGNETIQIEINNKSLLDHDYERTNRESEQANVEPQQKNLPERINTSEDSVSLVDEPFPANKSVHTKFFIYKGNMNNKIDYTQLMEIDEKEARSLTHNKTSHKRVYLGPKGTTIKMPIINKPRNITRQALQLARRVRNRQERSKVIYPADCKTCGEHLESEDNYKTHIRLTKHFHTSFACDHCDRVFPTKSRLNSHKTDVMRTSRLCDKCGASFNSRSGLLKHYKVMHSGQEKYKCGICGARQADLKGLRRHRQLIHPGVKMPKRAVMCELCGRKLSSPQSLYLHRRQVHLKIRPLQCTICDKKFYTKALLKSHQSVHSLVRFDCGFCNARIKQQERFEAHRKVRHPALPMTANVETEYTPSHCTFCEDICFNKQALSLHLREHGLNVCFYCDTVLKNGAELENHLKELHTNLSEWMCRYCNKTYDDGDSLYSHLSIHKYKAFKCDQCPKTYDSSNKLKRHKLYHEGALNYGCRFCPRKFLYKANAAIHERTHTAERPYKCDICGATYKCASSKIRHRHTHFINPEGTSNVNILPSEAQ